MVGYGWLRSADELSRKDRFTVPEWPSLVKNILLKSVDKLNLFCYTQLVS